MFGLKRSATVDSDYIPEKIKEMLESDPNLLIDRFDNYLDMARSYKNQLTTLLNDEEKISNYRLGWACNQIGLALRAIGFFTDALTFFKDAIKYYRKDTQTTNLNKLIYQTSRALASTYMEEGRAIEAKDEIENCMALLDENDKSDKIERADLLVRKAEAYAQVKFYSEAVSLFKEANQIYKDECPFDKTRLSRLALALGNLYAGNNELKIAQGYYDQFLKANKSSRDNTKAFALQQIALIKINQSNFIEALEHLDDVQRILEEIYGDRGHAYVIRYHLLKASYYLCAKEGGSKNKKPRTGDKSPLHGSSHEQKTNFKRAEEECEYAQNLLDFAYQSKHYLHAEIDKVRGIIQLNRGLMEQGVAEILSAISIKSSLYGANHYVLSDMYMLLANCLISKEYYLDAYRYYEKGYDILDQWWKDDHVELMIYQISMAHCVPEYKSKKIIKHVNRACEILRNCYAKSAFNTISAFPRELVRSIYLDSEQAFTIIFNTIKEIVCKDEYPEYDKEIDDMIEKIKAEAANLGENKKIPGANKSGPEIQLTKKK